MRIVVPLLLVLSLSTPSAALAAPGDGELHVNRTVSGVFSLAGAATMVVSEALLKDELAPLSCRWCDGNRLDLGVRDALVWDDVHTARTISDVNAIATAPLAGFGLLALSAWHDDRTDQIVDDQLIVLEAVVGAALLNQGVKLLVGRERPFVRALPDEDKRKTSDPYDNNLSFYSGHSSLTFSIAVASGTVASLRGYRGAPWIWVSGLTVAASTGYLRIAGDKHYFTDVLTGAVVGSFVGFAVPYWLHRNGDAGTSSHEAGASTLGAAWGGGGPMLSWSGTF